MRKIFCCLAVLFLALLDSPAHAQSSKATLNTEITTNWPNNTTGAITPALLRSTVSDIVASYVDWLTCTSQGGILYWDVSAAPACLGASTSGYLLKTQGAGANPVWVANTASMLTVSTNFRFIGTTIGANQAAQELSASTLFDWIGSTQGSIPYRTANKWNELTPGTTGYVLRTNGTGADPTWVDPVGLINFAAGQRVLGRLVGAGAAQEITANSIFDWIGSTRGSLLYRGATQWQELTPGTAGYTLSTGGPGADPSWTNPVAGGTVTLIDCAAGLTCTPNPITTAGTITPDVATAANVWTATKNKLIDANVLTNAGSIVPLTPASPTSAVDFSLGVNFSLALTGSSQLGNPANLSPGRTGCVFITKDLTSRTLSYNTSWKFAGGAAPTLSTTNTTTPDVLCYMVYTSTFIWATMTKDIR